MTVILSRISAAGSELPLLLHLGSLTNTIAQVVELGSADVATGPDLDAVDNRRVDREGPLNPDTETELANRERFADSAALALYDHALEQLHALAVPSTTRTCTLRESPASKSGTSSRRF